MRTYLKKKSIDKLYKQMIISTTDYITSVTDKIALKQAADPNDNGIAISMYMQNNSKVYFNFGRS